jgi:hypothetical protein
MRGVHDKGGETYARQQHRSSSGMEEEHTHLRMHTVCACADVFASACLECSAVKLSGGDVRHVRLTSVEQHGVKQYSMGALTLIM